MIRRGGTCSGYRITALAPVMLAPSRREIMFRRHAIVARLLKVPPVQNETPGSTCPIALARSCGPPVGAVADVEQGTGARYGAHPAGPLGHCIECHTPQVAGEIDFEIQLGAGGREFEGPWGVSVSANLTGHESHGITGFADEELARIITAGTRTTEPECRRP
jgi:hypothetical protein